ncbi:MAG: DUF547 domain-containing protein [Luteitalea sp.]|nr:DUF547 domain-containing protein [Luteitalea sp.]
MEAARRHHGATSRSGVEMQKHAKGGQGHLSLRLTTTLALVLVVLGAAPHAQPGGSAISGLHATLDAILDLYVRDGLVYYRTLRGERARLDRYAGALNVSPATYEGWSRDEQAAFWVNAYNTFVLRTVINNYPIRGRSTQYPPNSIRQVPGAFERLTHRAAGRSVTLDQIEKTILPAFGDPRLYLALGRGAVGSGRLRSEAYTGAGLAEQLEAVAEDCVDRSECSLLDKDAGELSITPIFSWHEQEFIKAYSEPGEQAYPGRSALELAILRLLEPNFLPTERAFLRRNTFRVKFVAFDWRLNDLTDGGPR